MKKIVTLLVIVLASNVTAYAQQYPARPVRMIVPAGPGSGADAVARIIALRLSERLGQQVVVDNRPGAAANIATEIASKAAPDGYTLLIISPSVAINASLYSKLNYDLVRDFAPISLVTTGQYVVVTHPSLPTKTIKEFIALAKAKPGELVYASAGTGSLSHVGVELFSSMAGVKMLHVPYKGGGPALIDLISGQVQMHVSVVIAALPHIKSGRLRGLAVTGEQRSPAIPSLPTVAESGLAGFVLTTYNGIMAPEATPRIIIERLNAEIVKIMQEPGMRVHLVRDGAVPFGSTPDEFAALLKSEITKWSKVVKALGLRAID